MGNLLKSLFENKGNIANEQVIESAQKLGVDNTNLNRFFDALDKDTESEASISYPFYAKFYDDLGNSIGSYGIGSPKTEQQIYVVSFKMLGLKEGNSAEEIVQKVGLEDNYNRMLPTKLDAKTLTPIAELKLSVGVFKLPPELHRNEIKAAIEATYNDEMNYEIGGCGYHKSDGQFLHLRAEDGKTPSVGNQEVAVLYPQNFDVLVEKEHQTKYNSGVRTVKEDRVEYTWHTHPPKTNPNHFQQMPSSHDRSFAGSYDKIKQHFMISKKFGWVYYFGFAMKFNSNLSSDEQSMESGGYNIKINYDLFFNLS